MIFRADLYMDMISYICWVTGSALHNRLFLEPFILNTINARKVYLLFRVSGRSTMCQTDICR